MSVRVRSVLCGRSKASAEGITTGRSQRRVKIARSIFGPPPVGSFGPTGCLGNPSSSRIDPCLKSVFVRNRQPTGAAGTPREFAREMAEVWCCAARKLIHAAIESELLAIRAGRSRPQRRPALRRAFPAGFDLRYLHDGAVRFACRAAPFAGRGCDPHGCSRNRSFSDNHSRLFLSATPRTAAQPSPS